MKKGAISSKGKTTQNLFKSGGSKEKKKKDTAEDGSTFKGYQDLDDSSKMDSTNAAVKKGNSKRKSIVRARSTTSTQKLRFKKKGTLLKMQDSESKGEASPPVDYSYGDPKPNETAGAKKLSPLHTQLKDQDIELK